MNRFNHPHHLGILKQYMRNDWICKKTGQQIKLGDSAENLKLYGFDFTRMQILTMSARNASSIRPQHYRACIRLFESGALEKAGPIKVSPELRALFEAET